MLGLATGDGSVGAFEALLAEELDVEVDQILSWDLGLMDLQPSTLGGLDDAFVFAPRLDNQASCHAGITALFMGCENDSACCAYDHEEVGSGSTSGASGSFVEDIMTRIAKSKDLGSSGWHAESGCIEFSGIRRHGTCHSSIILTSMSHVTCRRLMGVPLSKSMRSSGMRPIRSEKRFLRPSASVQRPISKVCDPY